jgi:prophage regulatory protein
MNIIRPSEVFAKVGLSRSTVWRMERAGDFPARIQLSVKAVGYDETAIKDWLAKRGVVRSPAQWSATCPLEALSRPQSISRLAVIPV